ncbi:doxx family protein [Sungkyunkwania multivorans]|uniref:Doxx family protein n=1 Tax=Sungkyunkwania multivorans TaxID=1173618 RepID=A0ABW3CSC7_9FLAO
MKERSIKLARRIAGNNILAISIGAIYLWFGLLKFFPGASPAEGLAQETVSQLTFQLISPSVSILLLATWEVVVGLFLLINIFRRTILLFAFLHMLCTFTPLFFFPESAFTSVPFNFTLTGQYIAKNVVIIAALFTLYKESGKSYQTSRT